MKKFLLFFVAIFISTANFAYASTNISSDTNYQALVDKTSSTVGSVISVQITFTPNGRGCGGSIAADSLSLSITGGATLSVSTVAAPDAIDSQTYDFPIFTINSTSTGTKDLSALEYCAGSPAPTARNLGTVTFVNPPTSNTTPKTTKTTTQTQPQKPATPTLTELKLNQNQYQNTEQFNYELGQKIQFSGKTIAGGKLTLTFNSEPFSDTATTDASGNWVYELTRNLGIGEHTMTYTVTDLATNLTSDASEAVKFTLVAAAKTEPVAQSKKVDYTWWYLGGASIAVLILGTLLTILLWKRNRKSKKNLPESQK